MVEHIDWMKTMNDTSVVSEGFGRNYRL